MFPQFFDPVIGPFDDDQVYADMQYCGTDLLLETVAESGGVLDSAPIGRADPPAPWR